MRRLPRWHRREHHQRALETGQVEWESPYDRLGDTGIGDRLIDSGGARARNPGEQPNRSGVTSGTQDDLDRGNREQRREGYPTLPGVLCQEPPQCDQHEHSITVAGQGLIGVRMAWASCGHRSNYPPSHGRTMALTTGGDSRPRCVHERMRNGHKQRELMSAEISYITWVFGELSAAAGPPVSP